MLLLSFQLGNDWYALDATQIVRVLPVLPLKQVPHAPTGVAGILKVREACVPVLDLCAMVIGRASRMLVSTRLILTRGETKSGTERMLGIIVEKATGTLRVNPGALVSPGVAVPTTPYLGSVIADGTNLFQIVNVDQLLSEEVRSVLLTDERR